MPMCDVLLFSDYFFDIIVTSMREVPHIGAETFGDSMEVSPGGVYNLAAALSTSVKPKEKGFLDWLNEASGG